MLIENFFDDTEEGETGGARYMSLTPSDFSQEASELHALTAKRSARTPYVLEEVPQHFLVPAQGDPDMWSVRVKVSLIDRYAT